MIDILLIGFEQSLLMLPLIYGIYLTYSIMKITDLTADGSFVLGAAVFAKMISYNFSMHFSMLSAIAAGGICGLFVSVIQYKDRIGSLISGILMVLMLQSINLIIMGKPNISVYGFSLLPEYFAQFGSASHIIVAGIGAVIAFLSLGILIHSRHGLILKGFGSNKSLLYRLDYNPETYRALGLFISNALASLCGILSAQIYGYSDVSMGYGIALTAIASVIIGGHILQRLCKDKTFEKTKLLGPILGAIIYFLSVNLLLFLGLDPINLKLVLGIFLVIFLGIFNDKTHNTK